MPSPVPGRPTTGLTSLLPLDRAITAGSLVVVLLLAVLGVAPLPAVGQAVQVHSPTPAPHAVIGPGPTLVGAVVAGTTEAGATEAGTTEAEVRVDGVRVDGSPGGEPPTTDGLGRTLVTVDLSPGRHLLAIAVGGEVRREWPVVVSPVRTRTPAPGPLAIGLAASGPAVNRPVLLVNPGRPDLSLTTAPLGTATGAVALPTAQDALPAGTREALAATVPAGGRVFVLGGLDAVGPDVVGEVEAAGYDVQRIGSGDAVDVAAAAAAHAPVADVYRRGGDPVPRPVLVAAAQPTDAALQAAAVAAQRGAGLVLVDTDGLRPDPARVVASRDVVWLAEGLDQAAADQVRAAAGQQATVSVLSLDPQPTADAWVVDAIADPATAVMASRAAGPDTAVLVQPDRTARWLAAAAPQMVTVPGDAAAAAAVQAAVVDGPAAATVGATLVDAPTPQVVLDVEGNPQAWSVHVEVHGREWPGTTGVEGSRITWTAGERPPLPSDLEPTAPTDAPLVATVVVAVDGAERHLTIPGTVEIGPLRSTSTEGFHVAGGSSEVVGTGPLRTFTIEIEPTTGLDLAAVTEEATAILLDPTRGWAARGERSLQRVATPAEADIRVVVARPGTVDAYCGRVGLGTGGRLSCWDGRRAMLNLDRWNTGVSPFHADLTVYRQYLVSHEVGHGLGYGHVGCPGSGAVAPVMMQQTKGLGACTANGWPYPNG